MKKVSRIIFVDKNGLTRAPMAKILFEKFYEKGDIEILFRGINVPFEEPINPKAEVVLIGNKFEAENLKAKPLTNYEITDRTAIFAMESLEKDEIVHLFENATEKNVFVLSKFVGDELEVMDPYGGALQDYGLCFETLKSTVNKLSQMISEGGLFIDEQ